MNMNMNIMDCDYLVVGGGATGMAFVDTLLKHSDSSSMLKVVMVDNHLTPGGQWHDSYKFVQLHQPSSMYGVETMKLEKPDQEDVGASNHRATRLEILDYYQKVQNKLSQKYNFQFIGNMYCDLDNINIITTNTNTNTSEDVSVVSKVSLIPAADAKTNTKGTDTNNTNTNTNTNTNNIITMNVRKRIVDARYLEPDLPIFVKPKFIFDDKYINCVPVNTLFNEIDDDDSAFEKKYVIIGAGKTGMDAITYLLTKRNISADNIMWIVPNEAWITARENIGSCMEFLHTCTEILRKAKKQKSSSTTTDNDDDLLLLQQGFLEWEKLGKVYRFDKTKLPTKFKDATLCLNEMDTILSVKRIVHGYGRRITKIGNSGEMYFNNNNNKNDAATDVVVQNLPDGWTINNTIFIHCSAGAFHYTKQQEDSIHKTTPLPFNENLITIQDVYGTPGFCFVGSIFGFLESLNNNNNKLLSDQQKNDLLLAPQKTKTKTSNNDDDTTTKEEAEIVDLGPSGGDIDNVLSINHGLIQRFINLRKWLEIDEMKTWLHGHRLFNLGHMTSEEMDKMVDDISFVLKEYCGIISID